MNPRVAFVNLPPSPVVGGDFAGGTFVPRGQSIAVHSPYTGTLIGHVGESGREGVEEAVGAAARAFGPWRRTPIKERSQFLFKFRELVLRDLELLAHMAAAEAGKTVAEARAGVQKGVEVLEFALALQNNDTGHLSEVSRGVTCQMTREPLGVVAGITPFNFPAMVPLWMYPIAIALGNCFVLKPSEKVPLTSQLIAGLFRDAGLPKGVFSVVNGGPVTATALIDHPQVQAVGFVGSTPAARAVYQRSTHHGKRCLALGGAKNTLIVAPDADPELTVRSVIDSFTGCAGQRCMAASLMVAVGAAADLIPKIAEGAARLMLGRDMGAIIDPAAKKRIETAVAKAIDDGARLILDGRQTSAPEGCQGGNWLAPTIIDAATPSMECARIEIFGPVLTIVRVKTLNEALAIERASPYGNATSVFTTSGAAAREVASEATAGMIGINVGVPVPREPFSFGGTKESRFGGLDITGTSSLELWSDRKKVTTKWAPQTDRNWMS